MHTHAPDSSRSALSRLRLCWLFFAGLCAALLVAGSSLLHAGWAPAPARRWTVQAGLLLIYLLWVFWAGIPFNRRQGETHLLPSLGLGNLLTLLRGILLAGLGGFLFSARPQGWQAWLPGALYTAAALLDYLDGWAARATDHATRLGERLDMSLDGVGVFLAALLAVQYGQAPAAFLAVALARPLYLAGLWLWQQAGRTVHPLPPSISRRAFAGLQMGFLFVILWPVFSPPGTHLAAVVFALPFLVSFTRDWFAAAGLLKPANRPAPLRQAVGRWLPLLLRLATAGLASILPILNPAAPGPWTFLVILELVVALLLLVGAAGRSAAILGLLLLGVRQMAAPLAPGQILLIGLYTGLLYCGTGPFSLWKPEDRLIFRRAGERRSQSGRPASVAASQPLPPANGFSKEGLR